MVRLKLQSRRRGVRAFTLIELVTVIIILTILTFMAVATYETVSNDLSASVARGYVTQVVSAEVQYASNYGNYADAPGVLTGLQKGLEVTTSNVTATGEVSVAVDSLTNRLGLATMDQNGNCILEVADAADEGAPTQSVPFVNGDPCNGDSALTTTVQNQVIDTSQTYDSILKANSPTAWWKLSDSLSSPTAADYATRSSHPGTTHGNVTFGQSGGPDSPSDASALFASNAYVSTSLVPNGYSAFTVSAWVNLDGSTPSSTEDILADEASGSTGLALSLSGTGDLTPTITVDTTSGLTTLASTQPITNNSWYNLAATYNGSTLTLYVNGFAVSSTSLTGTVVASAGFDIGQNGSGSNYTNGTLAQVSVFNSAISASNLASIYESAYVPPTVETLSIISVVPSNNSATITWTDPDVPTGLTGYVVTSSPGGLTCSTVSALSCTVTGLTSGVTYTFTVQQDTATGLGTTSAPSASVADTISVPGTPTNITALTAASTATVTWSAPLSNGGSPITSYELEYSPSPFTTWSVAATNITSTSYTVSGLTTGTSYEFKVAATNADGQSPYQSTSTAQVNAGVPGPPLSLGATAANAAIDVSWSAPLSNGGTAITSYVATASPGNFSCSTTGAAACNITGLTNATAYTVEVVAINEIGTSSPAVFATPVTPFTVPSAPLAPVATPANTAATINWSAPATNGGSAITLYTVTSSPGSYTCTSVAALSCTITGLTNAVSYTFTVTAANAAGAGASSIASSAIIPAAPPGAPTAVSAANINSIANGSSAEATITWTAPASNGSSAITGYTVTSSPGSQVCNTTGATSCIVTNIVAGTSYTFSVTASNTQGPGPAGVSAAFVPATVPGSPTGLSAANPLYAPFTQLSASNNQADPFTCGITAAGSLYCWGENSSGQLGNGGTTFSATPVAVTGLGSNITSVSAGRLGACAITNVGALYCWGSDSNGQVGNGTTGGTVTTPYEVFSTGVTSVTSGLNNTTCAVISGAAKCWGDNSQYQFGNGTTTSSTSPTAVTGLGSGVTSISGTYYSVCALTSSGAVACWGQNGSGQLGNGTTTSATTPVTPTGLSSGASSISVGYTFSCAIVSGAAKCWGAGGSDQLGDGATGNQTSPTAVTGLTSGVTQISAGLVSACATTASTLYCWGSNANGELGTGGSSSSTPQTVTLPTGAIGALAAGANQTDITVAGYGYAWGANDVTAIGQLGTGSGASIVPTPAAIYWPTFTATVSWSPPASSGGSSVTSYSVTSSPSVTPSASCTATSATNCQFSGLTTATSYVFSVTATNTAGTGIAGVSGTTLGSVPGPPTTPTATPNDGSVTVSWSAPGSNGGSAITLYTATSSPGSFTCTTSSTTCTVMGLTDGTSYTFSVTATNANGTGPSATTTPVTPYNVPGAPTALGATSANASASLTWTAPASNGGSPITGYKISDSINSGSTWVLITASTNSTTTSYSASGLTNGTSYIFEVAAVTADGPGAYSTASNAVIPSTTPGAPTSVVATPGSTQASISWAAPSSTGGSVITSYTVTSSPGGFTCATAGTPTCTITGLTNGTSYTFSVTAANANGTGPASASSASIIPQPSVPGAPTAVSALSYAATTLNVSWSAPAYTGSSSITLYTVTSSPSAITCTSSTTTCVVEGLSDTQSYTFTVTATNATGTGAASAPSTAASPYPTTNAPTNVVAVAGNTQEVVSWNAPSLGGTVTGYTVTSSGAQTCTTGLTNVLSSTDSTFTSSIGNWSGGTRWSLSDSSTHTNGTTDSLEALRNSATAGFGYAINSSYSVVANTSYIYTATIYADATSGGLPYTIQVQEPNGTRVTQTLVLTTGQWTSFSLLFTPTTSGSAQLYFTDDAQSTVSLNQAIWIDNVSLATTTVPTTCTVTGLTNGTPYTFTSTVTFSTGSQYTSAPSSATTPEPAPAAPTSVLTTPGNSQVSVSWTAPATNGGPAVTGYTVTSSPGSFTCTTTGALTCTVAGLTNGTSYTFSVTATNSIGTGPASSASTSTTPYTVPSAPTAVTAVPGNAQASISWTAANANGSTITLYTVTSSPGSFTCTTTGALTCIVNGLTNGTSYTFSATATNTAGTGAASTSSAAIIPTATTVPGPPLSPSAVPAPNQATVSWTAPTSNGGATITAYNVTSTPGSFTCATTGALTCIVTGLTNGTSYTFKVTATNSVGTGASSAATAAVTPTATVPAAPTGATAVINNTWVNGNSIGTSYNQWSVTSPGTSSAAWTYYGNGLTTGNQKTTSQTITVVPGTTYTLSGNVNATYATTGSPYLAIYATNLTTEYLELDQTSAASGTLSGTWTPGAGVTQVVVEENTNNATVTYNDSIAFSATSLTSPGSSNLIPDYALSGATSSPTAATIYWTPPSSNGGAAITLYTATSTPGSYTCTTATTLSCTITGLTTGTSYTFKVTATNSVGTGAASTTTAAVVPGATTTFSYTGGTQSYTVPSGVTSINFTIYGAEGGQSSGYSLPYGGEVTGTLTVTPGEVLTIIDGQDPGTTSTGGYGGGGNGSSYGYGGGGATTIEQGSTALTIAGGGGGGVNPSYGGNGGTGGGTSGTASGATAGSAAGGGTQSAGGTGGTPAYPGAGSGGNGSLGQGGTGGAGYTYGYGGGGGGGGYYGGGGGGGGGGPSGYFSVGGGGGSSYVPTGGTTTPGVNTGNGSAIISYN